MATTTKKSAGKKKSAKKTTQAHVGRSDGAIVVAADGFKNNADLPRGFNWRTFDAYLFDIDGTLLISRDAVHYNACLTAMQELFGKPVGLDGVPIQGSTDPIILLQALEQAGVGEAEARGALQEAMARICCEVEANAKELRAELCVSVPELLKELKFTGKLLGVTSGNMEKVGWAKLKAAKIEKYFSFGSFSDRNETRTEIFRWGAEEAKRRLKNENARVCFVGDTPADVAAAKACGFPVIAVATGIFSLLELAKEEPDLCLPCCETLWSYAEL